jgi:hypothetical protein
MFSNTPLLAAGGMLVGSVIATIFIAGVGL